MAEQQDRALVKGAITDLNLLLKEDHNAEVLVTWYNTAPAHAANISRNRIMSALLDIDAMAEAEKLLQEIKVGPVTKDGTLLQIRYYVMTDQVQKAHEVYCDTPVEHTRKRHVLLIMDKYLQEKKYIRACEYFMNLMMNYVVEGSDIVGFLNPEVPREILEQVLDHIIGLPTKVPRQEALHCIPANAETAQEHKLELLDFTETQVQCLMSNLDQTFKEQAKARRKNVQSAAPQATEHYDYIIDGANVLFYRDRRICLNGYKRITGLLKALHQHKPGCTILLVLHERHFRPKDKWKGAAYSHIRGWKKYAEVLQTPRGFNDDYYSLLNSFPRPNSLLVTNDKFRDHIFKLSSKEHNLDLIAQWRQEKVIEYDFDYDDVSLLLPQPFSFRVQKIGNKYYVPTEDHHWMIL